MFKKAKVLKDPADYDHGYQYALFLLNLSMRTLGEIKEKMQKRGYTKEVIKKVTHTLVESKFVDDAYYAEVYINNSKNFKFWGKYILRQKMLEKKLPKDLVEDKLEEFFSEVEEMTIAKRYVVKNFGSLQELKKMDYKDKQKIYARLASRGFGLDLIKKLI